MVETKQSSIICDKVRTDGKENGVMRLAEVERNPALGSDLPYALRLISAFSISN